MMTPTQRAAALTFANHAAYAVIARGLNELLLGSPAFNVSADIAEGGHFTMSIKGPLGTAVVVISFDQASVDLANATVAEGPAN